jgi:uncharacterized protein DUF6916
MSISRRLFIRIGTVAAIAGSVSMRPDFVALGQKLVAPQQTGPLSFYTMATFLQYVNSVFILHGSATVEVVLTSVQDILPAETSRAGGRESFILHFRGGSAQSGQETFIVEHPALGTFALFLVPGDVDDNGTRVYVATINRLDYLSKPIGPRKPLPMK